MRDDLGVVTTMLPIDLAQSVGEALLACALLWVGVRIPVDEVIEARELLETVLPTELVETRHTSFPVTDQVECCNVEHAGRRITLGEGQVLQKPGMVLQRQG